MFLGFDTETTGLPDYSKPLTDPAQPRIVQLGFVLCDETGREMVAVKTPIRPDGWEVDETGRAFEVNGLTQKDLMRYGMPIKEALEMFNHYENMAELKFAHNYRFDGFIMKGEYERAGVAQREVPIDKYCTMKGWTDLKGGKYPKLTACYEEIMNKPLDNAHDSLADVRAAKEIFFWLKREGHFKHQPRYVPAEQKEVANG